MRLSQLIFVLCMTVGYAKRSVQGEDNLDVDQEDGQGKDDLDVDQEDGQEENDLDVDQEDGPPEIGTPDEVEQDSPNEHGFVDEEFQWPWDDEDGDETGLLEEAQMNATGPAPDHGKDEWGAMAPDGVWDCPAFDWAKSVEDRKIKRKWNGEPGEKLERDPFQKRAEDHEAYKKPSPMAAYESKKIDQWCKVPWSDQYSLGKGSGQPGVPCCMPKVIDIAAMEAKMKGQGVKPKKIKGLKKTLAKNEKKIAESFDKHFKCCVPQAESGKDGELCKIAYSKRFGLWLPACLPPPLSWTKKNHPH